MLLYSHFWDALLKLTSLAALVIGAMALKLDERFHSVAIFIAIVTIIWIVLYRQYVSILSSWLYARVSLGTVLSFGEAKASRRLFQLDFSGKWVALRDIKKLPVDARHTAVLQALETFGSARKAMLL